jgi:predicted fused transcriptional regulator/phosphomethylpyrimidine kinase/predicted transcriptional regulator
MRLPDETVVDSFLPTFRCMLARELASRGLRESRIAAMMGLSQAAISKYRRGTTRTEKAFMEDDATLKIVKKVADGLHHGKMSELQVLAIVMQLIRGQETRGLMCRLHEREFPMIAGTGCNICIAPRGGDVLEEENVLSNLRSALRLLESTKGLPSIIPNVGMNIAMAKKNAKDLKDVAAVPGRIYEVRGGVKVPAAPEFEASTHVAGLILVARRSDPKIFAGINIKFSEEIIAACTALGWKPLEVRGEYQGREAEIDGKMSKGKSHAQVVYHRGAFGIEPMVYIVGETAIDVVEKVRTLLSQLAA